MPPTRFQGAHTINAAGATVIDQTSPVLMDGAITIGQLSIPVADQYILTNATITENNPGDVSINVAAAQNAVIGLAVSEYIKQINAFLSTTSVPALNNSGFLADDSGDAPVAKGTMVTGLQLSYSIQAGPLTTFTARMDLNVQTTAQPNVITNMIPVGQNGLIKANTNSATACIVTVIPVPLGNQIFDTNQSSALYVRLNVVTPGGCTFRLYGAALNFTFNYN